LEKRPLNYTTTFLLSFLNLFRRAVPSYFWPFAPFLSDDSPQVPHLSLGYSLPSFVSRSGGVSDPVWFPPPPLFFQWAAFNSPQKSFLNPLPEQFYPRMEVTSFATTLADLYSLSGNTLLFSRALYAIFREGLPPILTGLLVPFPWLRKNHTVVPFQCGMMYPCPSRSLVSVFWTFPTFFLSPFVDPFESTRTIFLSQTPSVCNTPDSAKVSPPPPPRSFPSPPTAHFLSSFSGTSNSIFHRGSLPIPPTASFYPLNFGSVGYHF